MGVDNFIWDSENQSVGWSYNENCVFKRIENAFFASLDEHNKYVFVEAGQNFSQDKIYYLNFDGEELFTVDKVNDKVSWQLQDQLVEVNCKDIQCAQLYIEQCVVIIISGEDQIEKEIKGFALDGTLLFVKSPPQGFSFKYLSTNKNRPSVVCDGDQANTDAYGRYSWHFIINHKTGDMSKESLAY